MGPAHVTRSAGAGIGGGRSTRKIFLDQEDFAWRGDLGGGVPRGGAAVAPGPNQYAQHRSQVARRSISAVAGGVARRLLYREVVSAPMGRVGAHPNVRKSQYKE